MKRETIHINEQKAADAFTKQSAVFDNIYTDSAIIRYKRKRVREHIVKLLPAGSSILELNAGTGEDAVWLAQHGYKVHATDISSGMLEKLKHKTDALKLQDRISYEKISYTELNNLDRTPYDMVFSNFGGLNCTRELNKVLSHIDDLLKPGGITTLVIISKFCLWELLLLFKGKFRTAFRRFFSGNGRRAHVEGEHFTCWYYSPSYVINHLKDKYELIALEGLCTLVPPSYIENFHVRHPRLFKYLKQKENLLKSRWPWSLMGDYYIISLRKKLR